MPSHSHLDRQERGEDSVIGRLREGTVNAIGQVLSESGQLVGGIAGKTVRASVNTIRAFAHSLFGNGHR